MGCNTSLTFREGDPERSSNRILAQEGPGGFAGPEVSSEGMGNWVATLQHPMAKTACTSRARTAGPRKMQATLLGPEWMQALLLPQFTAPAELEAHPPVS